MTAPRHHLPRELLADYVAGHTTEAVSLVVACHLTLCARCTGEHAALERVAAASLERAPAASLPPDLLAQTLARLDDDSVPAPTEPPRARLDDASLPRPLLRLLERLPRAASGGAPRWKRLVRGIDEIRIPVTTPGTTVRLLRLEPQVTVPLHGHEGDELIAVFAGGLEDGGQVFERGDVELRGAADRHTQRILPGAACVALVVNHGRLRPLTWGGRLFQLITGA